MSDDECQKDIGYKESLENQKSIELK